jgi:hypothetical protein
VYDDIFLLVHIKNTIIDAPIIADALPEWLLALQTDLSVNPHTCIDAESQNVPYGTASAVIVWELEVGVSVFRMKRTQRTSTPPYFVVCVSQL